MAELKFFKYDAFDAKRSITVHGSWWASSREQAQFWLASQGFTEITLREGHQTQESIQVNPRAKALFFRQLAVMFRSATPLHLALKISSFTEDRNLSGVCLSMSQKIANGHMLSTAMGMFPNVFSSVIVNIIATAEKSGGLVAALNRIADSQERQLKLKGRVTAALIYPAFLLGSTALVTFLFLFFILPLDQDLFGSLGVELPAVSYFLVKIIDLVRSPWSPLLFLLTLSPFALALRSREKRQQLQNWTVRKLEQFPVFGSISRKIRAVRLLQVLELCLRGGGTLDKALLYMRDSTSDSVERRQLIRMRLDIVAGEEFKDVFMKPHLFPSLCSALLNVGYETGRLDEMCRKVRDLYEEDIRIGLDTLTSLVEPFLLGCSGVIAGFVIITTALPFVNMLGNL